MLDHFFDFRVAVFFQRNVIGVDRAVKRGDGRKDKTLLFLISRFYAKHLLTHGPVSEYAEQIVSELLSSLCCFWLGW